MSKGEIGDKTNTCAVICQIAWVVTDIASAEKFFTETMGVEKFMRFENLSANDTEGTYKGTPGNYVFSLYIAYAGDTQIETPRDDAVEKVLAAGPGHWQST